MPNCLLLENPCWGCWSKCDCNHEARSYYLLVHEGSILSPWAWTYCKRFLTKHKIRKKQKNLGYWGVNTGPQDLESAENNKSRPSKHCEVDCTLLGKDLKYASMLPLLLAIASRRACSNSWPYLPWEKFASFSWASALTLAAYYCATVYASLPHAWESFDLEEQGIL